MIADYNALTEQLIDYNRDSLEWLVCNVNSRSTVFSSMLAELESLRLISELISSGEIIEEIIVDNDELRKTISNLYPKINVHGKTSSLKIIFVYGKIIFDMEYGHSVHGLAVRKRGVIRCAEGED